MPPKKTPVPTAISKTPTGIVGLDEITQGGLPAGRPTLVAGSAGAGKTMLAAEFIVRGATQFDEPGVFMMFEENIDELSSNVLSLGFDLKKLVARKKIVLDHVHIERSEIEETGEYDLEGLFIRLDSAIRSIGAKRVVLDTIEALFAGLPNHAILRAELRRLFRWLKERGVTAVITGERGEKSITRYGLEEYVADCVITLDHRVTDQISTRRLRVVKYRGSAHGTNEYPFLISEHGFSVIPITSLRLQHEAPVDYLSTGIPELDEMLGRKGIYRASSVLVSGAPGTGKSSVGAAFVHAACARGEKAVLFAYEESDQQIIRNMKSIGMDLGRWVKSGLLRIHASRPTLQGLEQHLLTIQAMVEDFKPSVLVMDPISNLTLENKDSEVKATLMRLIDYLKDKQITALFTSLTHGSASGISPEDSQVGVSSLMDVWLLLRNHEQNGERNRSIYVLKARGIDHSNQVREFILTGKGIKLIDVYLGSDGVLTGSARASREARDREMEKSRQQEHSRKLRAGETRRKLIEAKIQMLRAEAEAEMIEMEMTTLQEADRKQSGERESEAMSVQRKSKSVRNPTKGTA